LPLFLAFAGALFITAQELVLSSAFFPHENLFSELKPLAVDEVFPIGCRSVHPN
jgi:hypothetical protein